MMSLLLNRSKPYHWAILVLAALLFLSPWLLGYRGEIRPEWNAWVSAVLVAYIALVSLIQANEWENWLTLALGVWLLVAPWLVGFGQDAHAAWSQRILGLLCIIISAWAASIDHERPNTT